MSEFWYYAEGDETRGPIAFDQLIKLLSQLPTPRGVLVWREGFDGDWKAAENVREIVEKLIRPPPLIRSRPSVTAEEWFPTVTATADQEGPDTVERYQQQFRKTQPVNETVAKYQQQFRKVKQRWSLLRSALYGFLFGLIPFVTHNLADGGKTSMHWLQNGRAGEIAGYFGGQLLFCPLLFVLIAFVRNLFIRTETPQRN
jgi:hypothetical protein